MLIRSFAASALVGGLIFSIFATPVARGEESDAKKKDEKKVQIKDALKPKLQKPFLTRLIDNFGEALRTPAWTPPDPNAPPSTRRVLPSPFDSPPFFESEFSLGGSPTLGDPNDPTIYPLMKTIYESGRFGQWLKDRRINIYGWVEVGVNASTSGVSNLPAAYPFRPNQPDLDQLVLYFERKPDEAQRSHMDWGFLFANLYGLDYRFTISRGILSSQLLRRNRIYGYDPVMFYLDFYIPWIFEGMNIRIGRYISVPDIEAQLAPQNPMYTHSILYNFDPFTQTGIITTTQINKNWRVQLGISASNDTAPWSKDAEPAGTVMFQWISNSNKDSVYFGANSFNDGYFHYNNLQMYVAQYNHKFNDIVNMDWESYYMYQRRVPDLPRSGKFSYAPEWGILNYVFVRLARNVYLNIRNEYYDDKKGQRTGFPTYYTEHAIGLTYWPNSIITIRPELRFDHAYQTKAYNNGTRRSQFMAAMDIIFHY